MEILGVAVGEQGSYFWVAVLSFISAVFPLVSAEIVVLGLAAASPTPNVILLAAVATAAQMAGKSTMYWVGARAVSHTPARYRAAMDRWEQRFRHARGRVGSIVFVSSMSGLPPFYVISALAGAFRTSFLTFLIAGTVGRFIRFASLAWFPGIVRLVAG
jgi:membrane protein YqaA with SNARE-associated domain